eukprot:CCRYP_002668-RA/>CCRYP_002668-RA protein AED:0.54 eAED:0.68 QI:0/0/0/0.5/0/0/2/0/89
MRRSRQIDRRAVGAHSVKVPARDDPDTECSIPLTVMNMTTLSELHWFRPSRGTEKCTHSGGYNSAGKRHSVGKLEPVGTGKWECSYWLV